MFGFSQQVLDDVHVREFYPVTNSIQNSYDFRDTEYFLFTNDEDEKLFNKTRSIYPFCPIFSEDVLWTYRVWRDIPLSQEINPHFPRRGQRYSYGDSIVGAVQEAILKNACSAYTDERFVQNLTNEEAKEALDGHHYSKVRIKEDWWYNKTTGEMKSYPIGLCLIETLDGADRESFWLYYPELRYVCIHKRFDSSGTTFIWSDVIEKHECKSLVVRTEMNDGTSELSADQSDPVLLRMTELESLFEVEEVSRILNWALFRPSGTWYNTLENGYKKIQCLDGTEISGTLGNNMMQGLWERRNSAGDLLWSCEFKNNIPSGKYRKYYSADKLREKGTFTFGVRTGTWTSYHQNGNTHSVRNYKLGGLDGEQVFYYDNKQKQCVFSFKNEMPNGKFMRWYSDGALLDSGNMLNGYQEGLWQVNVRLNDTWKRIMSVCSNKDLQTASDDGILTLNIMITVEVDKTDLSHYRQTRVTTSPVGRKYTNTILE